MSAITSADKQLSKLFINTKANGTALTTLGQSMVAVGAGAIAMAGGVALVNQAFEAGQVYADYETSMANVQGLMSLTRDEMAGMEAQASSLARTTRFTSQESMDAFYELYSAGLTLEEGYAALETTLHGAVIGQMEASESADMLTTAMRAFNIPAEDSVYLLDRLAKGAQISKTHWSEYTHAFGTFGGVMGGTNQTLEDSISLFGLFRTAGMSASKASMMVKMMGTHLIGMNAATRERMQDMGLDIFDQFGEMKALPEILEELFTVMPTPAELLNRSDITGEEIQQYAGDRLKFFVDMFGMRAVAGIMNVKNAQREVNGEVLHGVDVWRSMTDEVINSQGYSDEYYNTIVGTWNEKFAILKSSINETMKTLGQPLIEAAAPYLDKVVEAMNSVSMFLEAHPEIAQAIVQVAVIGGVLLTAVGAIVLFGGLISLLSGAGTIIGYVALAVASIVTGVGGIVTAGLYIKNHWEQVKLFFVDLGDWLWSKFGFIIKAIVGLGLLTWMFVIKPLWNAIKFIIWPALQLLFGQLSAIVGFILIGLDVVWGVLQTFWTLFETIFTGDWASLGTKLNAIWVQISEEIVVLGDLFFNTMWEAMKRIVRSIVPTQTATPANIQQFQQGLAGEVMDIPSGPVFGMPGSAAAGVTTIPRDGLIYGHEGEEIVQRGGSSNNSTAPSIANVNIYSYGKENPEDFARRVYAEIQRQMSGDMEAVQNV